MPTVADSAKNAQPERVRAARAFAGLTQGELGERLGVSAQLVKRVENGRRLLTDLELIDAAEACGVPAWFMFSGWEGSTLEARDVAELWARVERLERSFESRVLAVIAALRASEDTAA
jgi:transcriptional regulator with XRE-family HTH domain